MADTADAAGHGEGETRRDFLLLTSVTFTVLGAACVAWPIVDSMNPAADVRALSSIEVDVSSIEEGQSITVTWRGKPVFIRHRTAEEISAAEDVDISLLTDPQADSERAEKPEILIMVGVCTHLGCVPLGQRAGQFKGDFGGWFCPCHGSHYDTSGRIRKGPAPKNLVVPVYEYLDDSIVKIG